MGVFRNKTVRNQLFLSLFFLVFTGAAAFAFDRSAGILYSFQEQDGAYCRFFLQKNDIKKFGFFPSN